MGGEVERRLSLRALHCLLYGDGDLEGKRRSEEQPLLQESASSDASSAQALCTRPSCAALPMLGTDKCPALGYIPMLYLAASCTKGSLICFGGLESFALYFPLKECSLKSFCSCHGVVLSGKQ